MADIIAQHYGRTCNGVEYDSVAAARQAAQVLLDRQELTGANSTEVILDEGAWVGIGWRGDRDWIVTGVHPANQAMVVMRCGTRTEAVQRAHYFARLIAADLVHAAFGRLTGRPGGRIGDNLLRRRMALDGKVVEQRLRPPRE